MTLPEFTTSTICTTARLCFRDAEQRLGKMIEQVEALNRNSRLRDTGAPDSVIVSKTIPPQAPPKLSLPVSRNVVDDPGGSFIQPTSLLGRPAPSFQETDQ